MRRVIVTTCVALLAAGSLLAGQAPTGAAAKEKAAGPDPWFVRTTKVVFQAQRAADAPVQIDLPRKDWMVLPSGA